MTEKTTPTLTEMRLRFKRHGFTIQKDVVCPVTLKRKWKYQTAPDKAGAYGHFNNKEELYKYLKQLDRMRTIISDIEMGLVK